MKPRVLVMRGGVALPIPASRALTLPSLSVSTAWLLLALIAIGAGIVTIRPAAGASTSPPAVSGPRSWLVGTTLLTVYGRGFGTAPVLGRLGMDRSFADLARQVAPYERAIHPLIGHRHIRIAVHLIYGLATPCKGQTTCLLYLDDTGVNIVKRYIEPAAKRGWLVILDDQLGRSSPVSEANRIIARGYLKYDNVEVAFDPEYRAMPGTRGPGDGVGSVSAAELNAGESVLNRYAEQQHLAHRKLMLVHQWSAGMITGRPTLWQGLPYVQPVVVMDGFGRPDEKARVYSSLLGPRDTDATPARGIKLFPSSPFGIPATFDRPMLSWQQVFGRRPAVNSDGERWYIRPAPSVIVMT